MTVDEIFADPAKALDLPDGSVPNHVIIIAEYGEPGSDRYPGRQRLSYISDDDLPRWTSLGMLAFATQLEADTVCVDLGAEDPDDEQ